MDSICPLEWRYGSEDMRSIFSRESYLKRMLMIETTLVSALEELGVASPGDSERVKEASKRVSLSRVEELERHLGHDVMAVAVALAEESGSAGRWVHFGATSYDIVDTSWALALKEAINLVKERLRDIISTLIQYSRKYSRTVMPGRTHGQHAIPITLGFKFANYLYEFTRAYNRLDDAYSRTVLGKFSGAVGTMAAWGDMGPSVEELVMSKLGLRSHPISTQVSPRDGFAEVIGSLAILSSVADRFALEIRELMRPEIDEVRESVGEKVGSSTMPQKENPVIAEKVSGLARVIRGLNVTALENIPLWHERDLTNSSSERLEISHAFITVDEILISLSNLLKNLEIREEKMRINLEITRGLIMAESLMVALTKKGLDRHKAHSLVSSLSREVRKTGKTLGEVASGNMEVRKYLSEEEVKRVLDYNSYLGSIDYLIQRTIKYAEESLSS